MKHAVECAVGLYRDYHDIWENLMRNAMGMTSALSAPPRSTRGCI